MDDQPDRVERVAPLAARFNGVDVVIGRAVFADDADPVVEIDDENLALADRTFRGTDTD